MAGATRLRSCYLGLLAAAFVIIAAAPPPASVQLSASFYAHTCPSVFNIVRAGVTAAIQREPRLGASLLRLHFHDCFVNGCDGSVLLDDTGSFVGEKTAHGNNASLRGMEVIDSIKAEVNGACGAKVVSCADILAIAARDSVVFLGGPSYPVLVGRRDARTASLDAANNELPSPFEELDALVDRFSRKGFTARDMVALSGAHTVGFAQCRTFRPRIYYDVNIDPAFAAVRRANCPAANEMGDSNLAPLDGHGRANRFGNGYFLGLLHRRGLLHSDQVLFNGSSTDSIVWKYASKAGAFNRDFAYAMVKMGNLGPLTGSQGEIRSNCRRVN